jgi:hypothetical protein
MNRAVPFTSRSVDQASARVTPGDGREPNPANPHRRRGDANRGRHDSSPAGTPRRVPRNAP